MLAATDVAQALFDWRRGNQTKLLRLATRGDLTQLLPSLAIPAERGALLAPRPVVSRISSLLVDSLAPLLRGAEGGGATADGLTLGDPSELADLRGRAPGLLDTEQIDELLAAEDPAAAIARRIVEDWS
jgi:hypothetical protein